jgi:hypothetical protein
MATLVACTGSGNHSAPTMELGKAKASSAFSVLPGRAMVDALEAGREKNLATGYISYCCVEINP